MSIEVLHTAARRYLLDRLAIFGRAAYGREAARLAGRPPIDLPEPPGDSDVARDLLRAVETRLPADFGTLDTLRRWLREPVLLANPWFRWPWHDLPWAAPRGR